MKKEITESIKKKFNESGAKGVVIGLSGGVDSTVVLFLCVQAFGKDKVLGVTMPSKVNKKDDIDDVVEICKNLGVKYKIIKIDSILNSFGKLLDLKDKAVKGNLMARIRMCILYYFANKDKLLVVGTGNKSEYLQGYFTLHGDSACDLSPLINLYKNEVRKLAEELGVPKKIIDKIPTAGLWKGQTDEDELGISYDELDKILPFIEKDISVEEIGKKINLSMDKIRKVKERMVKTSFKRKS